MIKPAKLYLIRHAPVKKLKGYFPKVNPNAIINHYKLKRLASLIPENCVWYISPLKRTIQTANALSNYVNYSKLIFENKLVEQNFGIWSGKKISEIWKILKKNKEKHNFSFIPPNFIPPNGESFIEQLKRVGVWLKELKYCQGQNVVVISHAGTIRSIIASALNINPDYVIGIEISYQSLSIFEMLVNHDNIYRGGKFRLITLNKTI